MQLATKQCDIVISSGGVSMGAADLLKPTLADIGTIHFGRLNMKPGKPTTFATVRRPDGRVCLFFALPGNPASCLVCKQLLVDPAISRLLGRALEDCLLPTVKVTNATPFPMDTERPEFRRVIAVRDVDKVIVHSTGGQRSSRLMSMADSNALVMVPSGVGTLPSGSLPTAYLTCALRNALTNEQVCLELL
jgi:gephyrin